MKTVTCAICGTTVERKNSKQILCGSPACRKENERRWKQRVAAADRADRAAMLCAERKKPEAAPAAPPLPRKKSGKTFDIDGKSLNEVALEAKALGMTYGSYCTACSAGTIIKTLASKGITPVDARSRIQKAHRKRAANKAQA